MRTRPTTGSGPWPSTLSPAQVSEAKSAIAAYTAYYALLDQAYGSPGKDWTAAVTKLAADPEKSTILRYFKATANIGQYGTGHTVISPQVTKVQTGAVDLTVCVDTTSTGFFNKAGQSIKAPNVAGSYWRYISKVQVFEYVGNKWLVTVTASDYAKSC